MSESTQHKLEATCIRIGGAMCGEDLCAAHVSMLDDGVICIALGTDEWPAGEEPSIALSADALRTLADLAETGEVTAELSF